MKTENDNINAGNKNQQPLFELLPEHIFESLNNITYKLSLVIQARQSVYDFQNELTRYIADHAAEIYVYQENKRSIKEFENDDKHFGDRPKKQTPTFVQDLATVINRHSLDVKCSVPDYLLAEYLESCLLTFNDLQFKNDSRKTQINKEKSY